MRLIKNKDGFTLIEIIVVMIIIGILAAIALPNIFNNINTSKGVQALASASSYKTPLELCVATKNTMPATAPCDFTTVLGGNAVDEVAVGAGWSLVLTTSGGSISGNNVNYTISGTDNNGAHATGFTLFRASNGVFTCTAGSGIYSTVC